MTDPRRHRHGEPCGGYALRRDRALPRRPDRGVPRNQRQVSGPGGVSRRTTRRGAQRRRPQARETRTTATRRVESRSGPAVGFDQHRTVVLDAWPLLRRYAGEEPSQTAVNDLLTDQDRTAVISTTNFGEVVSAFLSLNGPEVANRQEWLLRNFVDVVPATEAMMVAAARIKVGWYITWGDAVAAATALDIGAPVWTGDSELLTPDACWSAADLRDEARKAAERTSRKPTGRRLTAENPLAHMDSAAIARYVIEPLRSDQATRLAGHEDLDLGR